MAASLLCPRALICGKAVSLQLWLIAQAFFFFLFFFLFCRWGQTANGTLKLCHIVMFLCSRDLFFSLSQVSVSVLPSSVENEEISRSVRHRLLFRVYSLTPRWLRWASSGSRAQSFHLLFTRRVMNERIWNLQILPNRFSYFPLRGIAGVFFFFFYRPINNNPNKMYKRRASQTHVFIMSNGAIWNRGMGVQRSPITYLNSPESPAECQVINCGRNTNSIQSPD